MLWGVFACIYLTHSVILLRAQPGRAFELGINFFDTSPYYGATRSEYVLGRGLAALPRDKIVVCSKVSGICGPALHSPASNRSRRPVFPCTTSLYRRWVGMAQNPRTLTFPLTV